VKYRLALDVNGQIAMRNHDFADFHITAGDNRAGALINNDPCLDIRLNFQRLDRCNKADNLIL
jgi:hypothetical protein